MRDGLTHACMATPSLHLYTKDDGRLKKKKKFPQRAGKSRMRDGLIHGSMTAPSLHLYTKDDGCFSIGCMAKGPCLEFLHLHCHYNIADYLAILNKIREHFYGSYSI